MLKTKRSLETLYDKFIHKFLYNLISKTCIIELCSKNKFPNSITPKVLVWVSFQAKLLWHIFSFLVP